MNTWMIQLYQIYLYSFQTQRLLYNDDLHLPIQGLCLMGEPCMTAFAIGSSDPSLNIQAVADAMETRGALFILFPRLWSFMQN